MCVVVVVAAAAFLLLSSCCCFANRNAPCCCRARDTSSKLVFDVSTSLLVSALGALVKLNPYKDHYYTACRSPLETWRLSAWGKGVTN